MFYNSLLNIIVAQGDAKGLSDIPFNQIELVPFAFEWIWSAHYVFQGNLSSDWNQTQSKSYFQHLKRPSKFFELSSY